MATIISSARPPERSGTPTLVNQLPSGEYDVQLTVFALINAFV
jgi:hypothetical protein